MIDSLGETKRRISAFLSREGFVFSIKNDLLKQAVGNICEIPFKNTQIGEMLIGLCPQNLYLEKILVIFITGQSKKQLLRVFTQSLIQNSNLEATAHFLVVPIDEIKIKRMNTALNQFQFLEYCQSKGIKIYSPELIPKEEIEPIELQNQHQSQNNVAKELLSLILHNFTRKIYLQSLDWLTELFGSRSLSYKEENRLIGLAIGISAITAIFDYGKILDVEEGINPFYILRKLGLSYPEMKKSSRKILSQLIRNDSTNILNDPLTQKLAQGVLNIASNRHDNTIHLEDFLKKRGIIQ